MRDLTALRRLQRHLRMEPHVSTFVRSLSTVTNPVEATQSPFSPIPFLRGLWTAGAAPVEGSASFPSAASPVVRGFASAANGNAAPPAPTPPPPPPPTPASAAPAAAVGAAVESASQEAGAAAGTPPPGPQSALWRSFKLALGLTSAAAIGAAGYATYAYDLEQMEKKVNELRQWKDETSGPEHMLANAATTVGEQYLEARQNIEQQVQSFSRPSSEKLLPDLRPGEQPLVYTLVLDLNDTLVYSDWKRERGWRTFKRPGATEFLEQLAPYYEIVVFSDQLNLYVDPIMDRLDPKGCVRYRLYRDATHYTHGKHMRDLSKLNRDLSHVIFVSGHGAAECAQPENVLTVQPWKMDTNDTALLDHLPFLEFFARQRPSDARAVLKSYEGQDVPSAFRERTKEYKRRLMERKRPRLLPGWGSSQS
ncbi:Haloacid dehalogenase-like hydrolase (HAD) superfamily protein [Klebsormidium nitens]|uniref:Mitochondrial import inner membrane translocase subunit TIM50 n=1 Tax=Klebsormidium nitens TaxID=105231 RepID=A0A1Y1IMA9_KLENI|nr:Haloacid dehalogenase-like hydrolase (HAD) superfamily protein [Klebsormidium nitens]|eukprot:GAQ89248.1 Haloacid dehalogenase-like hydrolase (HAD) superfamily protein [Klebsormidium nitens]